MIIEDFSTGYYRISMKVVPYEEGPVMQCDTFDYLNRKLYPQTDVLPRFRLGLDGNPYFEVSCESAIPSDYMGIPESWFADNTMIEKDKKIDVFILKPKYAFLLKQTDYLSDGFDPSVFENYK